MLYSIKQLSRTIFESFNKSLTQFIKDVRYKFDNYKIKVVGDIYSEGNNFYPLQTGTIPLKVKQNSHIHSNVINGSVPATPNSIVKRDSNGCIYSNSNTIVTGYKLFDGTDIGTFFKPTSDILNINQNDSGTGAVMSNTTLIINSMNSLTLTRYRRGTYCYYGTAYYCW